MQVRRGILAEESSELLREFFRWRRSQPGYCGMDVTLQQSADPGIVSSEGHAAV